MKRLIAAASILCAALLFVASPAQAAPSGHFIKASASGPDSVGDLLVDFTLVGARGIVTVTATADLHAEHRCGGLFEIFNGAVSSPGDFTASRSGKVIAALTLSPPASTLECPPGSNVMHRVVYTNVAVSAGGEIRAIPGTFEGTFS
jgi:hypothetical protein